MVLGLYAAGHFAVDFLCAWLILGRFAGGGSWVMVTLVYNFLAFAMQMPVGVLADRVGRNRACSAMGAGLVLLALLPLGTWFTVCLAGLGNALYHIGGGRETILTSRSYGPLGVFVAPGALGIFLGGLTRGNALAGLLGGLLLLACGVCLAWAARNENPSPTVQGPVEKSDLWILGIMFLVVLLRSLVGLCSLSPWKTGAWVILGAVLGAAGKALGGFSADRLGGRLAGAVSLLLAAALMLLPENPVCGVLSGLLFNMSMPITLRDSCDRVPGGGGFVFGLMTMALFLGFVPTLYGFVLPPLGTAALAALSGVLLAAAAKGR